MIDLRSLNLLNLAGQLKAGKGLAITGLLILIIFKFIFSF